MNRQSDPEGERLRLEKEQEAHDAEQRARLSQELEHLRLWPRGNHVLVREVKRAEKTRSGLLLPPRMAGGVQEAVEELRVWEVLAVSPDPIWLEGGIERDRDPRIVPGAKVAAVMVRPFALAGQLIGFVEEPDILSLVEDVTHANGEAPAPTRLVALGQVGEA